MEPITHVDVTKHKITHALKQREVIRDSKQRNRLDRHRHYSLPHTQHHR